MSRKHEKRDPITGEYYPAAEPHVDGQPHRGDTVALRKDQRDLPGASPALDADSPGVSSSGSSPIDPAQLKAAFLQVMVDAGNRGLDVSRDQVVAELVNAAGAVHRQVAEAQAAAIVEFFMSDEG
jgi:hypothetical protein